jgi:transcriptional regulator with XRE-family HTH domain
MIQEVCHRLKEKREELGYTLEQIVTKTKLHPTMIKDIEACNFDSVNITYLKGFLKIYANFLGVELGTAMDELDAIKKPVTKKEKKAAREIGTKAARKLRSLPKRVSPRNKKNIGLFIAALIALWLIFNIGKFMVSKVSGFFNRPPKKVVKQEQPPKSTTPMVSEAVDGLSVSLRIKRRCYVSVIVDGKLLFKGSLNKGSVESWQGNKEIEFKISDGSAVDLEVNGKSIPTLSSMRKPIKSLKITPSGISVVK